MSDPFGFGEQFGRHESMLWQQTFGDTFRDPTAEALYHEGYFSPKGDWEPEQRTAIREAFRDYLIDEYGIDFDIVFDWEAFREMYDA